MNLHYRNEKNIIIIISLPPGVWAGTTILVVASLLTRKMIAVNIKLSVKLSVDQQIISSQRGLTWALFFVKDPQSSEDFACREHINRKNNDLYDFFW